MTAFFRTDVLADELGVLAQAIACALDLDNDGVVQQAVQRKRCAVTLAIAP
jgi:hypothetical protein